MLSQGAIELYRYRLVSRSYIFMFLCFHVSMLLVLYKNWVPYLIPGSMQVLYSCQVKISSVSFLWLFVSNSCCVKVILSYIASMKTYFHVLMLLCFPTPYLIVSILENTDILPFLRVPWITSLNLSWICMQFLLLALGSMQVL